MGLGQSTTRGTNGGIGPRDVGEQSLLRRIWRALLWELRAELYPKWVKESLPVPDAAAADRGHLFEDVQLGALILKLPLGLGLTLAAMHLKNYQWLFSGTGCYLAADFLYQFIELSRGERTWARRRNGTLVAEILGAGGRLIRPGRGSGERT